MKNMSVNIMHMQSNIIHKLVEVEVEAKGTGTLFFNSGRALNGGLISNSGQA